MTGEAPAVAGAAVVAAAAAAAGDDKTEFAKRNPHLEKFIPDAIENFVDKLIPDALEAKMDRGAKVVARKYSKIATDFNEGFGEIAGVLFKVAKYAASRFNIGDIVFGVYHLADHHNKMAVVDAVDGAPVTDAALVKHLVYCTDLAVMSYCPTKEQLCEAATIPAEDVVTFQPKADTNRPAYCIAVDNANKNVIWGFRGTTDLSDMLTDACASCTPYLDGYAHWGMLEATKWFAENELKNVRALLDEHPGYRLLLVGHSLGAGVATLLAHWIKNNEDAAALMKGIDFEAVGVATPAVLTAEMAEGCSGYVSSVVQMHDVVPRFSIHNVFAMKEEMDATKWGDTLAEKLKDWMVPDVIERSETYQRLARHVSKSADAGFKKVVGAVASFWVNLAGAGVSLMHFGGCVKPNTALHEEAKAAGGGNMADNARRMANATGRTAQAALHDPKVVATAAAHVAENMQRVAHEDVHAVYAPGRLFFLRRTDPEADDESESEDEGPAAGITLVDAGETDEAKAAAAAAAAKMERRARAKARREERKRAEQAAKAAAKEAAARGEAAPEEEKDPYPGATFELIEGAPAQRFKRIALRETCLMDHLCGGYIQGLEYALTSMTQPAGAAAPAGADAADADAAPAASK